MKPSKAKRSSPSSSPSCSASFDINTLDFERHTRGRHPDLIRITPIVGGRPVRPGRWVALAEAEATELAFLAELTGGTTDAAV